MNKFDILITDYLAEEGLAILRDAPNINFDLIPGISHDEIKSVIGKYDAIITRSGTTVDADLIDNLGNGSVLELDVFLVRNNVVFWLF